MKIKKTLMLFLGILFMVLPTMVDAVCSGHDIYDCPEGTCKVEGNECVNAYVGENVCEEENVKSALKVAGYFVYIAKILVPFIIIGFGVFDLVKAVTASGTDMLGKQVKVLGIRVLIGLLIFFIPTIVSVIVDAAGGFDDGNDYKKCLLYIVSPIKAGQMDEKLDDDKTRVEDPCSTNTTRESCHHADYCSWNTGLDRCVTDLTKTTTTIKVTTTTTTTTSSIYACANISDVDQCNSKSGCNWNSEFNLCVESTGSTEEISCNYDNPTSCNLATGCKWNDFYNLCGKDSGSTN